MVGLLKPPLVSLCVRRTLKMNGRNGVNGKLISALIVLAQIAAIVVLYWARITTFIITPGRFHVLEPLLSSDIVVFALTPIIGTIVLGQVLTFAGRFGKLKGYVAGTVLSGVAFAAAMLIGLNVWGS